LEDPEKEMKLGFQVQIRIQKPVEVVFDAVQKPEKLSGYFTNGGASGPLEEGATVQWAFADNPDREPFSFPVKVIRAIPGKLIAIEWQGAADHDTIVEMNFENPDPDSTIVRISESGWNENQEELDRSYSNCHGWSQMLLCLKAYLEYGINLRKGAYEGLY
jgi:uncharacterized protein YndB with AHSA1/START domain